MEDGCEKDVLDLAKFPMRQPVPDKKDVY